MSDFVTVAVNGDAVRVPPGVTVAATVALAGLVASRQSVTGEARGPLCGIGICFECRVTIDAMPHRVSCQIRVEEGMDIRTR